MNPSPLLVRAALNQKTERSPVWFMRQAGRYLPPYQTLRKASGNFLDLCTDSDLAAEISLQPLEWLGVDGVILFSDILTPLINMGAQLEFTPSPIIHNPIREPKDVDNLRLLPASENTPYVGKALAKIRQQLPSNKALIGFAGAPFTLACYLVEGQRLKDFHQIKALFYQNPQLATKLMRKLTTMTVDYLNYQINAGAQIVQLFDSWAGQWAEAEFKEFVLPSVQTIFNSLKHPSIPKVYYAGQSGHLIRAMAGCGADMLSLDWRVDLQTAHALTNGQVALQGNLDPSFLFAPLDKLKTQAKKILDEARSIPVGHVFNLGGGIGPTTPYETVQALVHYVKNTKNSATP